MGDVIVAVHCAPSKKSGCIPREALPSAQLPLHAPNHRETNCSWHHFVLVSDPTRAGWLESVLRSLPSPQPPSSNKRHYGLLWVPLFQDTEFSHFGLSAYSSDGAFLESKEEGTRMMFALAAKEIELNSTWLVDKFLTSYETWPKFLLLTETPVLVTCSSVRFPLKTNSNFCYSWDYHVT